MHSLFVRAAALWVPVAIAVTGVTAAVYGAVQQDLRQGANDPQIQMAEDATAKLNAGAAPSAVVPSEQIELQGSLQPYIMVFDTGSHLIASSAQLDGQAPPFPPTVFDTARTRGQDRITWQPTPGIRSAVVVQPWRAGFVVVGRSLRLAEERIDQIFQLTGFAWLVTLGCTAIAALLAANFHRLT